jgi:hypothetical protein
MRGLVALLLIVAGCDARAAPVEEPLADRLVAAHRRMHDRFAASRRVEQAIALGDLERARSEARTIIGLDEPEVVADFRPYFEGIVQAARDIDASKDLVAAAYATGRLGGRCARCHAVTNARIVLAKDSPPPDDQRLAAQMTSHHWAATQMWEGLVARSDARWIAGARLLAAGRPIAAETERLGIADDAAHVQLFARRALTAKPDERGTLFGDLLARCAHCHYTIRDTHP